MSTADDGPTPGAVAPLGEAEAAALFSDLVALPALLLAVSGGPDSTALLILAARWRAGLFAGPRLIAATVDHGLRPEGAAEAAVVRKLAGGLGLPHHTLRWTGKKPAAGLQEAARAARYGLLAQAAREAGARHVLTAHTRDDQAETVLFRLARGSGLSGLAGMARVAAVPLSLRKEDPPTPDPFGAQVRAQPFADANGGRGAEALWLPSPRERSSWRGGVGGGGQATNEVLLLVRPFLDIPKTRLIATLAVAGIPFADDPSNRDSRFTRARLRTLLPGLATEGLSAARLAQLAARMRRADAALEAAVERLAGDLGLSLDGLGAAHADPAQPARLDAAGWVRAPAELRLRLLGRLIGRVGNGGAVELGKLETLAAALAAACAGSGPDARFRRTLAGAMVTLAAGVLTVEPAPPRRSAQIVAPAVPTPTET
ncbi:MAG: tRNA lysidine(34) synthetase TilS [Rhodoplanes sp.]|uniref:tRNA lysidine(34) synthetase TilS n=1 Tax=Rhodoplanes sp. TaxID=1968906 RepID=UPI0017E6ECFA|nr:tRNA lysidine(34) synthetase TilS [Rhodoplanes sp.]NVO17634.1 tRNA lysidine(34) synthetase TilS [Rhodoplanes sp.]